MPSQTQHREEILTLLRRADCHYGNTLRDEEAGWSVERASRERNVQPSRIVELRRAVNAVADGEPSRTKAQAGHEDGVLRALLHFRGGMSEGLRQHIDTRLAKLRAEFIPGLTATPLQCTHRARTDRSQPLHVNANANAALHTLASAGESAQMPRPRSTVKAKCRTPGKRLYKTQSDARFALRNQRSTGNIEQGRVYFCNACRGYHITSQERKRNDSHGKATGTLADNRQLHEVFRRLRDED